MICVWNHTNLSVFVEDATKKLVCVWEGHTPGHSQLDAALGGGHDPVDERKEEQTTMQETCNKTLLKRVYHQTVIIHLSFRRDTILFNRKEYTYHSVQHTAIRTTQHKNTYRRSTN